MPSRIAFFPVEAGIAHTTRSLAIAEELQSRGHEIIFALPKRKHPIFKNSKINFTDIEPCLDKDDFSILDKFKNPDFLHFLAKSELAILENSKPDIAIVDYRLSAIAACASSSTQIAFISGGGAGPYDSYIPNLTHKFLMPFLRRPVGYIAKREKLKYVNSIVLASKRLGLSTGRDKLLREMIYIVPEHHSYMPVLSRNLNLHYVSPIFWKGFEVEHQQMLAPHGSKTIYITFGGTGFDEDKLINLSSSLVKDGYRVVVSSSTVSEVANFPKMNNLYVSRFVSTDFIKRNVDIVICHGGYGTLMQALMTGKPVIMHPYNLDQLLHSLRVHELGLGICLINLNLSNIVHCLRCDWRRFESKSKNITVEKIKGALSYLERNYESFKDRIQMHNDINPQFDGACQAADVIESYLRK